MGSKEEKTKCDMVNHPKHYKGKHGIEAIDVIEEFELNFHLGNAVKYVLRSGKKYDKEYDENLGLHMSDIKNRKIEDLRKAIWYLEREVNNIIADIIDNEERKEGLQND